MCGLTAVVQLGDHPESKPKTDVEREIDNSLERVKHRGPDAQGRWISRDGRVGMFLSGGNERREVALAHVQKSTRAIH